VSDRAVQAIDVSAAFYDDFTSGCDHADWTGSLERLARAAGMTGRRALDLAWIEQLTPAEDGCWRSEHGVHVQRHPPAERLHRLLRAAGPEPVSEHGSHLSGRLDPGVDELRHAKAVYVARAAAPERGEGR
jgi:hypothetical protein